MKVILIIGLVWPEPKSSAAGSHMLQLIEALGTSPSEITFASTSTSTERTVDLSEFNINTQAIKVNDATFDDFLKTLNPDIVVFDRFMAEEQFGWRVAQHCPDAMRILNTEDLHCLRKGRELALEQGRKFLDTDLFNSTAKREIASIYRSDLSLIISEAEIDLLIETFKVDRALLHYFPFLLNPDTDSPIKTFPGFENRDHFITIGNFMHPPNADAVLFLKETIWPLIRDALPDAEMHVYGSYMPDKFKAMQDENIGFLMKGFIKNVDEVMMNARVCLAPLRYGAGLKGKLMDAMLYGTPFITSSVGAEGVFIDPENEQCIADESKDFAMKAVELYGNQELWVDAQQKGFRIIKERFHKSMHTRPFVERVDEIQNDLDEHRKRNFIGAMLMYHALQSTKYMSKWIELKNKK